MLGKIRLEQLEQLMAEFAMKQDRMLGEQQNIVRILDHHSDQIKFLLRKQAEMSQDIETIKADVGTLTSKVDTLTSKVDTLTDNVDLILTTLRDKLK